MEQTGTRDGIPYSLAQSIRLAAVKKLLEGYRVYATQNTIDNLDDLLAVVTSAGGQMMDAAPASMSKDTLVLSSEKDKKLWPKFTSKGFKVYSHGLIVSGVLLQRLDLETNLLAP